MNLTPLADGALGLDTNNVILPRTAELFAEHGYRFACRYIRRVAVHDFDLSLVEISTLHGCGLGVIPVQHVESETAWEPTATKGHLNGTVAVSELRRLRMPVGTLVFLDLEATAGGDPIAYVRAWEEEVLAADFVPGIYVGWHCGITPTNLYRRLKSRHYWGAGNLNADEAPAVRGLQMRQHWPRREDGIAGVTINFNTDVVRADALGGRPTALLP
jgi:hypothetical protein